MHKILAIDQSLTASGFCSLCRASIYTGDYYCETFKPASTGIWRLQDIEAEVVRNVAGKSVDLVVIEGYAYGFTRKPKDGKEPPPTSTSRPFALGELGGVIKLALHKRGQPFIVVPPSCLKQWACGKGNAPKKEVERAAYARWGTVVIADDNQADAAWLAEIGWYVLTGTPGSNEARREVLATLQKQRG